MRRRLLLLTLLLVPSFATAQGFIRYYPPGFTGGSVASPILGPSACTSPAYSFTADTDAGLCLTGVGDLQIQSAASGTRGILRATNSGLAQIGVIDAGAAASRLEFQDDLAIFTLNGSAIFRLDSTLGSGLLVGRGGSTVAVARSIAAGTGISVANGDGLAGNPTVSSDTATTPQFSSGTGLPPATCTVGQTYMETDVPRSCECSATNTWTCSGQVRTHATDCTALTDGLANDLCLELDSERLFTCQPTAGGCDTAGEWILSGDGSAALDINGLTSEPLINPFDDTLPFYDSSAAANRKLTYGTLGGLVSRTYWRYETDFIGVLDDLNTWFNSSVTGGASMTQKDAEASHPGIQVYNTGAATNESAGFMAPSQEVNGKFHIYLGGGRVHFTTWVRLPTLSDGTDTYSILMGATNAATYAGTPTDAIYFTYSSAINSGKWRGVCTEDSASTNVDDTGTAVAGNTWYRLDWEVNAAATSIEFFVNGTSIGTCGTNVPDTNDPVGPNGYIKKSAGTNPRTLDLDAVIYFGEFTTPR